MPFKGGFFYLEVYLTHRVQDVAVTAAVQEGGHGVVVTCQSSQVEDSLTGLVENILV